MATRQYDEKQAEEIAGYINSYATLQAMGAAVSMTKSIIDWRPNYQKDDRLIKAVTTLRNQLVKYKKEVPEEIRQKLSIGMTESQLESLATNILLQDGN